MKHRVIKSIVIATSVLICGVSINNSYTKDVSIEAEATSLDDYYAAATGTGSTLFYSLRKIINNGYKSLGYDGLYNAYLKTDSYDGVHINDYYSCITNYTLKDKAGNYKNEGDCFNREHSIPQSWWGRGTGNQGCDVYIVIPTDGYVNNRRSNYPFGEVGTITYQSANGYSKLGSSSFSGYSGTVFEPNDEYKGDFARIYFYALTKWSGAESWTGGYGNIFFTGSLSNNFGLTDYAYNLLMKWNSQDPVSDYERNKNDAAQQLQGNRNPYVDHPEYINAIWGGEVIKPTSLTINNARDEMYVDDSLSLNVSVLPSGASNSVTWSSSNSAVASVSNDGVVKALSEGETTISAVSTLDTSIKNSFKLTVKPAKSVSSIQISGIADKLSYYEGEQFNPTGLTIKAIYDDGTFSLIDNALCTFSSLSKGDTKVTITYKEASAVYDGITVLIKQVATNTFEKVTSNLSDWTGTYLLVYENSSTQGYVWTGENGYNKFETFAITDYSIKLPDTFTVARFSVQKYLTGYSILMLDGINKENYVISGSKDFGFGITATAATIKYESSSIYLAFSSKYLQYNDSAKMFRFYDNNQKPIQLYKAVNSSGDISDAESYASKFLETITCSGKGSVTFDKSQWNIMAEEFNNLSTDDKNTLINAKPNLSSSSLIEQFAARYDAIVNKYPDLYDNFMNRSLTNNLRNFEKVENNNLIMFIVLITSITVAVGSLTIYLIKKKKSR